MYLNKLAGFLFVFAFGITGVFAQLPPQMPAQPSSEVSDSEMKQFALAFSEIQRIDQQVQQDMMSIVQEKGIDVERFNEYLTAQQDPSVEVNASEEELEEFTAAFQEIEEMHNRAEQEMQEKIEENGLPVERYQEIAAAIQSNPELLQKLQQYFEH